MSITVQYFLFNPSKMLCHGNLNWTLWPEQSELLSPLVRIVTLMSHLRGIIAKTGLSLVLWMSLEQKVSRAVNLASVMNIKLTQKNRREEKSPVWFNPTTWVTLNHHKQIQLWSGSIFKAFEKVLLEHSIKHKQFILVVSSGCQIHFKKNTT